MRQTLLRIVRNPAKAFFIGVIRFYQVVVSPELPGRCKYYPSCSQYALEAVGEYGAARGFVLGAWRVLRCNPFSYGGYDPISGQKLFRSRGLVASSPIPVGGGAITGAAGVGIGAESVSGHSAAEEHEGVCTPNGHACRTAQGRHVDLVRG
jgi:uncharacterized protein